MLQRFQESNTTKFEDNTLILKIKRNQIKKEEIKGRSPKPLFSFFLSSSFIHNIFNS